MLEFEKFIERIPHMDPAHEAPSNPLAEPSEFHLMLVGMEDEAVLCLKIAYVCKYVVLLVSAASALFRF